jgi:hypothetical protein
MFGRKHKLPRGDAQHTPLLAMWYQTRTALSELIIPLLAGLKTLWLLFIAPVRFFGVAFHQNRPLESLFSPFDPFWRTLTPEARRPLDPAHFLLFGVLAADLAGFTFDNSNRLTGLLGDGETGLLNVILTALARLMPALNRRFADIEAFLQSELFAKLKAFIDTSLLVVIGELIINLVVLVVFAYLVYVLMRGRIPAAYSYAFWLYAAGLQFVTTGVSQLFFTFFSLPTFTLPQITPELIFVAVEWALLILWQFLYPAYVLPRVFPGTISAKQVLIASLLGRAVLALAGWLIFGGLVLLLALLSA